MNTQRQVCYVSGTRADFGLMQATLASINNTPDLKLAILITGMHLHRRYGSTAREVEQSGFSICARIHVDADRASGATMATNLATVLRGCVTAFEGLKPDIVLLLGDRGEMLGAALAAIHLNIPIVHIHGGERSGTIDEPLRHAISKLAHYHFVATADSRERLIRMGETPENVFVTGAPGLDGLLELPRVDRANLCKSVGFESATKVALYIYHPVVQEATAAAEEGRALLNACLAQGMQVIAVMPNSDAGSDEVRAMLEAYESHPKIRLFTHLSRPQFVSWMAACDIMVGNSSSGIIEAASFGTPVLNIGTRQKFRQRNANVTDVSLCAYPFVEEFKEIIRRGRYPARNIYGDGRAGQRITELLSTLPLSPSLLMKTNAY